MPRKDSKQCKVIGEAIWVVAWHAIYRRSETSGTAPKDHNIIRFDSQSFYYSPSNVPTTKLYRQGRPICIGKSCFCVSHPGVCTAVWQVDKIGSLKRGALLIKDTTWGVCFAPSVGGGEIIGINPRNAGGLIPAPATPLLMDNPVVDPIPCPFLEIVAWSRRKQIDVKALCVLASIFSG